MPTSSIAADFNIYDKETAERFADAIEASYQSQRNDKREPIKVKYTEARTPEECKALLDELEAIYCRNN